MEERPLPVENLAFEGHQQCQRQLWGLTAGGRSGGLGGLERSLLGAVGQALVRGELVLLSDLPGFLQEAKGREEAVVRRACRAFSLPDLEVLKERLWALRPDQPVRGLEPPPERPPAGDPLFQRPRRQPAAAPVLVRFGALCRRGG